MAEPDAPAANACARCAQRNGRGCCEVEPGTHLASLTPADARRIRDATGWRFERFVEVEPLTPAEVAAAIHRRPGDAPLLADGVRHHLRAESDRCVLFVVGRGCRLTLEERPMRCRLYPFEVDADGSLHANAVGPCLALDESPDLEGAMSLLDTHARRLRGWARRHAEESEERWP